MAGNNCIITVNIPYKYKGIYKQMFKNFIYQSSSIVNIFLCKISEKDKQRIVAYDIIRVIAIGFVVLIHSMELYNYNNAILYLLGRCGVPLFFMLMGAYTLPKNIDKINFIKNKVINIYFISIFWYVIYSCIFIRSIDIISILQLKSLCPHLWYVSELIFMYIFIPFLSDLKYNSTKTLAVLICLLILLKWLNLFGFGFPKLGTEIIFLAFIIYGYLITDRKLYLQIPCWITLGLIGIFIGLFYISIGSQFYLNLFLNLDIWWYYSPFIVIISMLLFLFFIQIFYNIQRTSPIILFIAKSTFGIYIMHYGICAILVLFDKISNVFLLFAITSIITILLCYLMTKVSFLKKLLNYN